MSVTRIVVGTDGSDQSGRAVRWAGELASQTGASVIAVHVFRPLDHLAELPPPVDFHALRAETQVELENEWCAALRELGVPFEVVILEGDAAQALVDAARDRGADLIVVGARGMGTVRGLIMGSTSTKLTHLSPVPLTIIHGD